MMMRSVSTNLRALGSPPESLNCITYIIGGTVVKLALYARGKSKNDKSFHLITQTLVIPFGGCGGCNHLIATALLVCNTKQSPNLCVHTYSFPHMRERSTIFLNPDQNNESICTNHLLSQVCTSQKK